MTRLRRLAALLGRGSPVRLVLLTAALCALWALQRTPLTLEESRLYRKVASAQAFLWDALTRKGLLAEADVGADPDRSGFIGVEWSMTTTTLGSLEAKRCATDPLWAVRALRWFDELGLREGDRVAVLASSSFPGLLYSVLAAAEERGLQVGLAVSLGSSTWGANRPEAPWPVLAGILRQGGFLGTHPAFYTLGGNGEIGSGMPQEARALLAEAAQADGTELFANAALAEAVARKMRLVLGDGAEAPAKLVVSIGGPEGNMGTDPAALSLAPGMLALNEGSRAGDGAIGMALRAGFPVLHLLNLRVLADAEGIAWSGRHPGFAARAPAAASVLGLALFALVLATHRRWSWEAPEEDSRSEL